MRSVHAVFAALIVPGLWSAANAGEITPGVHRVVRNMFMMEYGPVDPPPAFDRFCAGSPEECRPHAQAKGFMETAKRLEQLDEVNRKVNREILTETDIEHYGVEDYWTIPKDGKGDCEDYALLKRHMLIAMGWPSGALLMTVVRIENGEGHAVLAARTNFGDLILDNRSDELKLWYQTPYSFKMAQSPNNPIVWRDLDPSDDVLPAPIAVPGLIMNGLH